MEGHVNESEREEVTGPSKFLVSWYANGAEKRCVQEIADQEENTQTRVISWAVRAFVTLYKQDPQRAKALARGDTCKEQTETR